MEESAKQPKGKLDKPPDVPKQESRGEVAANKHFAEFMRRMVEAHRVGTYNRNRELNRRKMVRMRKRRTLRRIQAASRKANR